MGSLSYPKETVPVAVRVVSTEVVKPASPTRTPRVELTPWDLAMFSAHYIQKGHLFCMPTTTAAADVGGILARLKASLSHALVHFFPLAGRLKTTLDEDGEGSFTHIDCGDQGAELIHAIADGVAVADVVAQGKDVPQYLIRRFFAMDLAVNHDGHDDPLLAVQVTELADGLFVGCTFNHAIGDGTSFWHFYNAWAEISRSLKVEEVLALEAAAAGGGWKEEEFVCKLKTPSISHPPVHDRWFYDGRTTPIRMPFRPHEVIDRLTDPLGLRERVFHFSPQSMAALKARANSSPYVLEHAHENGITLSSFQSLSALLWRSITRARRFPESTQRTSCRLAIENRARLRPRLSPDYFGNSIYSMPTTSTVGELLTNDLGWAAFQLNRSVAAHTDRAIRDAVKAWTAAPVVYRMSMFDPCSIQMGSSPRFDMYGCEFGWGRAVALRSGAANKFDGKVSAYPGREGGGSVDLEVCLVADNMAALERDDEFMAAVSSTTD